MNSGIKKILLPLIIITIIIAIVFAMVQHFNNQKSELVIKDRESNPGKVTKIEYLIVKSAFMNDSKIFRKNAALFITNKEEINKDQELFLADRKYSYLCGYDYAIQFWRNSDSLESEMSINSKCESFNYKPKESYEQLASYLQKLETAPTHYIYNLKLSVQTEPEELKKIFNNSGLRLFFMENASKRFPSVYLYYDYTENVIDDSLKKHSEKKINSIIEKIKTNSKLLHQSKIYFDHYYGNSIGGGLDLKFAKGTDLNKIVKLISNEKGAKAKLMETPATYYVQLIDTSSNLESIRQKLINYKIIQGIYEYTK